MFMSNPFAELSAFIPAFVMQGYVVAMALLVIGGTVLDMIHKKSAQYFFENAKKAQKSAKREVSTGEKASHFPPLCQSECNAQAGKEEGNGRIFPG